MCRPMQTKKLPSGVLRIKDVEWKKAALKGVALVSAIERIASGPSQVILSLAVLLFAGFGMTRITKRLRLPT